MFSCSASGKKIDTINTLENEWKTSKHRHKSITGTSQKRHIQELKIFGLENFGMGYMDFEFNRFGE
jgi:hypothetical protein